MTEENIPFAKFLDSEGYTTSTGSPLSQSKYFLGEDASYQPVYVPSPYRDSRQGEALVISASGLKEIQASRQTLFNNYAWMRQQIVERLGENPDGIELSTAALLSVTIDALPTFLVHHRDYAFDPEQIPSDVAHMYRANAGILSAISFMQEVDDQGEDTLIRSGEEVYAYADRKNILVKEQSGEACAAPRELITRTVDALFFGEGGAPKDATVARLFPTPHHVEAMLRYGDAYGAARAIAFDRVIYNRLLEEQKEELEEINRRIRDLYDDSAVIEAYMDEILNTPLTVV